LPDADAHVGRARGRHHRPRPRPRPCPRRFSLAGLCGGSLFGGTSAILGRPHPETRTPEEVMMIDLIGGTLSQWLITVKSRPLDIIGLLIALFGLGYLSIGILLTPDGNHVMGAVLGLAALAVLWGLLRALRNPKRSNP